MSVNNAEVTDAETLQANRVFGSLGELAVMVLPQTQINLLIKKLDLANVKEQDIDYMAAVKDGHLKEILAKEILTYDPPTAQPPIAPSSYAKLDLLLKARPFLKSKNALSCNQHPHLAGIPCFFPQNRTARG